MQRTWAECPDPMRPACVQPNEEPEVEENVRDWWDAARSAHSACVERGGQQDRCEFAARTALRECALRCNGHQRPERPEEGERPQRPERPEEGERPQRSENGSDREQSDTDDRSADEQRPARAS